MFFLLIYVEMSEKCFTLPVGNSLFTSPHFPFFFFSSSWILFLEFADFFRSFVLYAIIILSVFFCRVNLFDRSIKTMMQVATYSEPSTCTEVYITLPITLKDFVSYGFTHRKI